jgi:hypothetical protein
MQHCFVSCCMVNMKIEPNTTYMCLPPQQECIRSTTSEILTNPYSICRKFVSISIAAILAVVSHCFVNNRKIEPAWASDTPPVILDNIVHFL